MKKIIILIVFIYSYSFSAVVVGDTIDQFSIKDQFGVAHEIKATTKKIVFAFSKATGHSLKDFISKQEKDFLYVHDMLFVADVSGMPSFIKFFVLPIKGYDFPILTLDDESVASKYKDDDKTDKILVISLDKFKITNIQYLKDPKNIIK
jgi:hypothetical protein